MDDALLRWRDGLMTLPFKSRIHALIKTGNPLVTISPHH